VATIVAASNSYADVNLAVNTTAARGDTVQVPAGGGTVTWTGHTLTITKGVILIGPGRDNLTIANTGLCIDITPDSTAITDDDVIRIEGFTFDGQNTASCMIRAWGALPLDPKPWMGLVIYNNRFLRNDNTTTSGNGAIITLKQVRGVISTNIFDMCNVILKTAGGDDVNEWTNPAYNVLEYGNDDNLFFENNSMTWSSSYAATGVTGPGWTESGQGSRHCMRYNNWDFTNVTGTSYEMFDIHGFQNWVPGPVGQTGTFISEYYGNTITGFGGYRAWMHRGSWALCFNNIWSAGASTPGMSETQYTGGTSAEVPGAAGNYIAEINNTYLWNNTINGTLTNGNFQEGNVGVVQTIFENSNWWNYNPIFGNGTNGIGRGTSAPTTTGNPNNAAYWVASTSTPTADPTINQAGHLYKMVGGSWVDYYTPYTYPHPLIGGAIIITPGSAMEITGAPIY
jgi:hypothetical protein